MTNKTKLTILYSVDARDSKKISEKSYLQWELNIQWFNSLMLCLLNLLGMSAWGGVPEWKKIEQVSSDSR